MKKTTKHHIQQKNHPRSNPQDDIYDLAQGSELSFDEFFDKFFDDLYHYGERITGDKELIKDCIQDLFVDLWINRKKLSEVKSMKYYLFKGLKRKVIKKLIRNRKLLLNKDLLKDYNFEVVFSHESELIARQVTQQQQRRLLHSLNKLTRREKEAITLKFFDEFSYKEVSTIMSLSIKSTYNLIYQALGILKENFIKIVSFLLILNLF